MNDSTEELRRRKSDALAMGGEEKIARLHARGALTARERIDLLLDPGSFFEIGMLNHSDITGMEHKTPADGKVCGFGAIDGRPVAVSTDDVTVLADSGGRVGMAKALRI
jgi:acetyl-CoA carboxylase carboxyltransferase component